MVRAVSQVRNVRPGYVVIHPNRDKPKCKLTKLLIVAILLASATLILVVTIGGWSKLQGLKPVNFIWCLLYVVIAFYVARWARGLLPIAAALAVLLLTIAAIAGLGLNGTTWFDRSRPGFAPPQSLLGGSGLGPDVLGVITVVLIPVEAALIISAIVGFSQGWNVELEVPEEDARRRGSKTIARGPEAAAA